MNLKKKLYNFWKVFRKQESALKLSSINYLPRWIILCFDIAIVVFSLVFTYLILQRFTIRDNLFLSPAIQYGSILLINVLYFILFKTYTGLIRHSTFIDIFRIFLTTTATGATLISLNYGTYFSTGEKLFIMPGIIIYLTISFSALFLFRVIIKELFQLIKGYTGTTLKKKILVLGTDDQAIGLAEAISIDPSSRFEIIGFLSNKHKYKSIKILGKPVIYFNNKITENIGQLNINGVLIKTENLSEQEKIEIVDDCLEMSLTVFNMPAINAWDSNTDLASKIKAVQIEDLLNREVIDLDTKLIEKDLYNKNILITGAAGSIGSELVKQIAKFKPAKLIILDQAETPLYNLELELKETFPQVQFYTELVNISNVFRLKMLFENFQFDVIYHAAAYKHVPIIEKNPHEAIYVNMLGTMNLANLAVKNKVSKFVMISTDKAVNPTNVMGASKRAAEMFVQSLQNEKNVETLFMTTRFGNVLGSNGSVIPHFKNQIAKGGPLTVTHPDIIRYFMTVFEACQLVLQAGTMGKGGEIFVFDMGKPLKILDLAHRMIRLSGFTPETEIAIKFTGLRPGEKLFEELLADESIHLKTHHEKIYIATDKTIPFQEIKKAFDAIVKASLRQEEEKVVQLLKNIVKEYKSENSKFSQLDIFK